MKSIVNRREKLRANDLPPEIPDISQLVTPTDYATDTKGGVIKVDSTYAVELTSGGKIKGKEIAYADYAGANNSAFISKATLDNVVANLPTPVGVTFEDIFSGSVTKGSSTASELLHPYTDYKMLVVTLNGTNFHRPLGDIIVSTITSENYRFQMIDSSYFQFIVDDSHNTFKIEGSGNVNITITGIK